MLGDRERILAKVEEKTGVGKRDMWERKGLKNVRSARKILQMCLRMHGMTTTQIGDWMKKDHSSVAFNTRHYKPEEEDMANEILLELGFEPQKMMTWAESQEYRKKVWKEQKERRKYVQKACFEKKIVPDYQNYCLKTVWEEKCKKNTLTKGFLSDGALCVRMDLSND